MPNNCPYCNGEGKPIFEELDAKLYINNDKLIYSDTLDFGDGYYTEIAHQEADNLNYCPICGRKIKKESEQQ